MPNTQADELDLGLRLRAAREAAGLSQRALAKRSGMPNSTISLIESGKMNPSVAALKRILVGIPIGLSEFFAFTPEAERRVFYAAEDLTEIGKGGVSLRQVGHADFGRTMMILRETLSYDFPRLLCDKGAAARHGIYAGQRRGSDRGKPGASPPRRSVIAPVFSSVLNGYPGSGPG